uniref:Chromatin assembly factor 1 subunit p150 C-terminal domain-containing protein n=1 Tax=Oryza meridionalis TaxID=40149 RepID=A0A0E0EA25_9ORYZ
MAWMSEMEVLAVLVLDNLFGRFAEIIALKMDGDEAKESAMDGLTSETASRIPDVSKKQPKRKRALVDEEVASAGLQGEIDELFDYYKEVSGYQLKPEEIGCSTNDSIVACLLEESSLPCDKLVDEIYKRMELRGGVTKSFISSSVNNIGQRMSYGISDIHDQVLVDESKSKLWCWEIRRMARKLIHERILAISGTPKVHVNQKNTGSVNASQNEKQPKHIKEKAEKEAKRAEREKAEQKKRAKKHQEEVEKEHRRRERQQAELKRQASIQKQANFMEHFLRGKKGSNMESLGNHHSMRSPHPNVFSKIEDSSATSAMDCTLSEENQLRSAEIWKLQIAGWRKLYQQKELCRWGVRRNPKIELFKELKLQKCPATAPSEYMSTPSKEQSSQMEHQGSLNFSKLLDQSYDENADTSKTTNANTSSSVWLVKKLLQFVKSHRPAYYGTWTKKSSTVSARHPFKVDPLLDYDVDSDEEWEEEEPGENLSDFDNDDEEAMGEKDSKHDAEEETDNSFVVPNDYLSEDEGVQFEPLSGKLDDTCRLLSIPGVAIEELDVVLQQQKALHSFTEHALKKDRPLVIYNLDHGKAYLLDAEAITGILKVEQLCLQALCMKEYPGAPIIDVPVDINLPIKDLEIGQPNKKGPSTPVASKSISGSDLPEFVKIVSSCPYGIGKLVESLRVQFPCVPKLQLKNKIREIADFTNNHWQVKKDILDWCGLSLPPDRGIQQMQPDESGDSVQPSPQPGAKLEVRKHQIDA